MFQIFFIFFIIFLLLLWAVYYFDTTGKISQETWTANNYELKLSQALKRNTQKYDIPFSLKLWRDEWLSITPWNIGWENISIYVPEQIWDSYEYKAAHTNNTFGAEWNTRERNNNWWLSVPQDLNSWLIDTDQTWWEIVAHSWNSAGNFWTPQIPGFNVHIPQVSENCNGGIIYNPCIVLWDPLPFGWDMYFGSDKNSL